MLNESVNKGDLPHLLFYGSSGTGKTSTIHALAMKLYGPNKISDKILELNASDENGINVVREKIIKFANIVVGSGDPNYPSPSFKLIILDEADSMTSEAQTALKKVMESTCEITRFVFICNYESKIIDAIKSRCAKFRFRPIPDDLMIEKLRNIAVSENMLINDEELKTITNICEGDARRCINILQNLKYIPSKEKVMITKEDISSITSYIDSSHMNVHWNDILNGDAIKLSAITLTITNTGYPTNYILISLKDKILESKQFTDKQKANMIVYIGKVERMITSGSDNYIQLLALMSYINGINKGHTLNTPTIF
jgi:replication factor C subunit 2/4